MPNTMFEKLREFAVNHKISVITARQPQRPGEACSERPTGNEPIFIDYINLL